MRAVALAVLVLTACDSGSGHNGQLSARQAIEAGDEELAEAMEKPQMKHHLLDVKAELRMDPKSKKDIWLLEYGGGCGGAAVQVDSYTGKATIIKIEQ